MHSKLDFSGKVVGITGGSRGLGRAIALSFLEQGAHVVVGAIDRNELSLLKTECEQNGSKLTTHVVDVTKRDECRDFINDTKNAHGRLDVQICNAGVDIIKPAELYEEREWNFILDTNLRGYFYCTQFAAQAMLKQGKGSIIMTSSIAGAHGIPGLTPYAASKGGIDQLIKTTAVEWAKRGIRVNGVAPGYVENIMEGVD